MSIARNFRIIREFRGKMPAEVVKGTKISKQNISAWENEKNNPGPEFLDQLSNYFNVPKAFFYKDGLTLEDLKAHFSSEKGTPAIKSTDNNQMAQDTIYKDLVEANTDYRLVPKIILDQYHIVPKQEAEDRREMLTIITKAKDDLIAKSDVIISKYEALVSKYESDIDELEATVEKYRAEAESLRSQLMAKVS